MAAPLARARRLVAGWASRPSQAAATSLRSFYAKHARTLPLPLRAELCLALGEAAELDGHVDLARWLYASAVGACDAKRDERLYARAALRSLLNASRLGDVETLAGVADVLERTSPADLTSRLAGLAGFARGLERILREDYEPARRSFEIAMGCAWETQDREAEALAHHLLAQAWSRLGKLARAREHAEAAVASSRKAGSKLLDRRLALESAMYALRAGLTAASVASARKLAVEVRKFGFPRLESLAWTKIARGILVDRVSARALLSRSEGLLPEGHPDRAYVEALQKAIASRAADGFAADGRVAKELTALVAIAGR